MSTTDTRLPLAEAAALAQQLCTRLASACVRLEVAGSIRRQAPSVGDIELVAIPRLGVNLDLFGEVSGEQTDFLEERLDWLRERGELSLRLTADGLARLGPRYKALVYQDAAVDLFVVRPPAQWGVIFAIRTGPATFSHDLVTPRAQGGRLPDHLRVQGGALRYRTSGEVIPTPEEIDLFAEINHLYVPPEARR